MSKSCTFTDFHFGFRLREVGVAGEDEPAEDVVVDLNVLDDVLAGKVALSPTPLHPRADLGVTTDRQERDLKQRNVS